MPTYTVHQAKTQLSRLIEAAENGEDVVIARGKDEVVRLVSIKPAKRPRVFGALKGKVAVGPEFFEPLPDDELAAWEGEFSNHVGRSHQPKIEP